MEGGRLWRLLPGCGILGVLKIDWESRNPSAMDQERSVSHWIHLVKEGDQDAVRQLWQRYYLQMVALARSRLHPKARGLADEEDVALSAFASFCRSAEDGRFPDLADRDQLWRLLVVITARKSLRLQRDSGREKRGGQATREEVELEALVGEAPTPEFAAQCGEQCRLLLALLRDPELVQLAVWKMEGYRNDEIAQRLDCAPRTVERKLQLIRTIWERWETHEP